MIEEAALRGWWRRKWLRAPGVEDRTTRVHWTQSERIYVDLRAPAIEADLSGARRLVDLDDATLLCVLEGEGFAGEIELEGDVCTWRRRINWRGRTDQIDAGRLRFGEDGDLYEDGVHLDYRERWAAESADALVGRTFLAGGMEAFLVSSDRRFAFGAGRPDAPIIEPVVEALKAGRRPDGYGDVFLSEYVVGRWDGAFGVADLSTNPLRAGKAVLRRDGRRVAAWIAEDAMGRSSEIDLR